MAAEPDREVGDALLDQRLLAGVGNLYKSEALFLVGVNPWTAAGKVDVPKLVAAGHAQTLRRRLGDANQQRP